MHRRAILAFLALSLAATCTGCALGPDHVTVFCERDAAETNRQRTITNKAGFSATYDLPR